MHSRVRALAFGADARFRLDLGHLTAAWMLDRPPPGGSRDGFTMLNAPGRMVAVYPVENDRAAPFFVHRTGDAAGDRQQGPQQVLTTAYAGLGWIVPDLLASLPTDSCGMVTENACCRG